MFWSRRVETLIYLLLFVIDGHWSTHASDGDSSKRWWKGNLHTHSLWSDGDDFPEMIAAWYLDQGYHFLALSDHNVLSVGERWMKRAEIEKRGGPEVVDKYLMRFGPAWVEIRAAGTDDEAIRLKPLDEFRTWVESPGRFLMMPGEEITDAVGRLPVHLNATNVPELIRPAGGATVREAIANNLRNVDETARRSNRKVLVHLNHPNFGWAVTPEDLAYVVAEKFFEIYNGHPAVNQLGDEYRPGLELMWDIANTLRIDKFKSAPLYGLGTDDSHNYHGVTGARPGRGWIQVRAAHLTPEHILVAIERGDFYASSGIQLNDVHFDHASRTIRLAIVPQPGVAFTTRFVGTPVDYDATWPTGVDADGNALKVSERYCPQIGTVFAEVEGENPMYQLTGRELYVRAIVTSSRPHPDPSFADQYEQAWTQPMGWEERIR